MQTAALSYKLIKKIKDEKFDEEKLQHYVLLIQLGTRDFQVAVIDDNRLRVEKMSSDNLYRVVEGTLYHANIKVEPTEETIDLN